MVEEVMDESVVVEDGDKNAEWNELVARCYSFANPIASRKQAKKIYKLIKKSQGVKSLKKGVRDVQKSVRKGERGIVILAGDTSPVDVISHLPVVCENAKIPYCYVPSKEHLGAASGSKRQTCAMLIKTHSDYEKLYKECFQFIKEMPVPL